MVYGSIPAGGRGKRLQPIGFSKELALVGRKAIIEYLIERMVLAGIKKIFINTATDKMDLIHYLSTKSRYKENLIYLVGPRRGLQDGILSPARFLQPSDQICFGLPDTIWFPRNAFRQIVKFPPGKLILGLFDTGEPEKFDSVTTDGENRIKNIQVKVANPSSKWTWGIGRVQVSEVEKLNYYAKEQKSKKPLFGVSLNRYSQDNIAHALKISQSAYLDIGRNEDYQKAIGFLRKHS